MRNKSTKIGNAITRQKDWMPVFLKALSNSGNVRAACDEAKIERCTAYKYKKEDKNFRKQWKSALNDACDLLESVAWKRASDSSDALLQFLLKAYRPKKYKDRFVIEQNKKLEFIHIVAQHKLSRDQIESDPILREAAVRWNYFGVGASESGEDRANGRTKNAALHD